MKYDSITECINAMLPRAKNGVILCSQDEHDCYLMLLNRSGHNHGNEPLLLSGNKLKII